MVDAAGGESLKVKSDMTLKLAENADLAARQKIVCPHDATVQPWRAFTATTSTT
jgi:hypothetical protein